MVSWPDHLYPLLPLSTQSIDKAQKTSFRKSKEYQCLLRSLSPARSATPPTDPFHLQTRCSCVHEVRAALLVFSASKDGRLELLTSSISLRGHSWFLDQFSGKTQVLVRSSHDTMSSSWTRKFRQHVSVKCGAVLQHKYGLYSPIFFPTSPFTK